MRTEIEVILLGRSRLFRLFQGRNHPLGSRDVVLIHVWIEQPGKLLAHLSIYDPLTGTEESVQVGVDSHLVIGTKRYVVVRLIPPQGRSRGWIEVARVGPGGRG